MHDLVMKIKKKPETKSTIADRGKRKGYKCVINHQSTPPPGLFRFILWKMSLSALLIA